MYKVKKSPSGEILKHKARLVAKGYVQKKGVDFEEVFVPIPHIETMWLLVVLTAQEVWSVHHMVV